MFNRVVHRFGGLNEPRDGAFGNRGRRSLFPHHGRFTRTLYSLDRHPSGAHRAAGRFLAMGLADPDGERPGLCRDCPAGDHEPPACPAGPHHSDDRRRCGHRQPARLARERSTAGIDRQVDGPGAHLELYSRPGVDPAGDHAGQSAGPCLPRRSASCASPKATCMS
jgi:hypothetical protein